MTRPQTDVLSLETRRSANASRALVSSPLP